MSITTIKATKVIETALALLERESVLGATVWRDGFGDFTGDYGDTVTVRLPAYTSAKKNALRSGDPRDRDSLVERSVAVQLTTRLYKDVKLTDENISLDIVDFTKQVMGPVIRSVVRGVEEELADTMSAAAYTHTVALDPASPLAGLRRARKYLNLANVPQADRFLAVGADMEETILNATEVQENLASSGDATALRDAEMGKLAGFRPFVSNDLEPNEGFAYHRTAFTLPNRAPRVPAGAPWGQSISEGGYSLRAVQVLDPATIENILATETWIGTSIVTDHGSIDSSGKFTPSENPGTPGPGESAKFVRAVKLTSPLASA